MSFTCCIRGASCATCEETTGGWCRAAAVEAVEEVELGGGRGEEEEDAHSVSVLENCGDG